MTIRRRPHDATVDRDRWLISYADFITLLLALFVVLFASSQPDKHKARQVSYAVTEALHGPEVLRSALSGAASAIPDPAPPKPATPPRTPVSELTPSFEYLARALAHEIQAGKVDVHLDARGLVISLRQAAYFPSGGDEIASSEYASLERVAGAIRDLPNAVQLEGHTDSAPIHNRRFRSNWDLSAARSIAMLELFEKQFGIPRERFAVAGYAETKPVDSNDSAEGRAHNRRVDIVILNR
jgi:chemotaxis protein MotB